MKIAVYFFLYAVELITVICYCLHIFKIRQSVTNTVIISFVSYIVAFIIHIIFPDIELFNTIVAALANFVIIAFAFNAKPLSALFHSLILSALMYLTEVITVFFVSTVLKLPATHYENNLSLFIVDSIICKALFFFISFYISLIIGKRNKQFDNKYWVLSFMPMSSLICTFIIHCLLSKVDTPNSFGIFASLSVALLLIANIIVLFVYDKAQISNQKVLELTVEKQKSDIDFNYQKLLEQKNEFSRQFYHDIKNHMSTISSIANSKDVDLYIESMYGSIKKYSNSGKSDNKTLDVILNKYTLICNQNEIAFIVNTTSDNFKFVNDFDLSALLNNLFDNAVESAIKCEKSKRVINFELRCNSIGNHILKLENSCNEKPNYKGNSFITTKKDSVVHGIGTKSINRIVEKYCGSSEWDYNEEKQLFSMFLVFSQ